MNSTTSPYAEAFTGYWGVGWRGVLPLPANRKTWPPTGYTGRDGADPSYPDCVAWAENGAGNIALRLPAHIIGIDVDDYDGKGGGNTLARLVDEHGALPATWLSTSRDDGISGIRLYTIPDGVELIGALPGIEIVQRHHRYIVAQPSIHPTGRAYQWIDERSGEVGNLPAVHDIPALPPDWVEALRRDGPAASKDQAADIGDVWSQLPEGQPCAHTTAAAGKAFTGDARHDAYLKAVLAVLGHARNGCPGAPTMIPRLCKAFLAEVIGAGDGQRTRGEAESEWARNLEGAIRLIATQPQGTACVDDLTAWAIPTEEPRGTDDPVALEYARKVAGKATEYRISEDAKAILAESRAEEQPAPESTRLDIFLDQPDTPIPWRVEGLWATGGRVLLAAAAKAGKTTLIARNLLPALADGGTFLGRFAVTPTEGAIVYLNLEVGADTVRRWLRGAGIQATDRVHVANLRGQASRVSIGTAAGRRQFARWLHDLGAGTVLLDPLAPLLAALGVDEDNNGQVASFFNMWNDTLNEAGVTEDLICHHTGHDGQRSRGASRLLDEPDAIWTITRPQLPDDEEERSEHRFLAAVGRDVELQPSGLVFDHSTGRLTIGGGGPAQARRSDYEGRVLHVVQSAGDRGTSQTHIIKTARGKEANLKEALQRLVRKGIVLEEDMGEGHGYRYWTLFHKPGNHSQ